MEHFIVAIDFTKKLFKSRFMLKTLIEREIKVTYAGSVFGFSWAVLNPLLQVAIYGVVFGIFFKAEPDAVYKTKNFFLFLLAGLLPWQFFSQAVSFSSSSIVSNRNLVKKAVGFPSEILPMVTIAGNMVSHLIALALFVVLIVFVGKLTPYVLLIFVYLFFMTIFSIGLGWILSSANVFLRDIQQIVSFAMMALMFFTPIFYSPSMVPPPYLFILKFNPMYEVVEGYRFAILSGRALPVYEFAYLAGISLLTLFVGGVLYRKLKPWFAEVL